MRRQHRAAIINRRRRADQIYAAITATSPTVFVPLEYAVNPDDGEQILYQDSAASVPVTTIGDPIGAVKWGGVIVATQTTDANRPTWGGVGVGAIFDGVNDSLTSSADVDFVSLTGVFSAAARCVFNDTATGSDTMIATTRGITAQPGIYLLRESRNAPEDRFRAFHASDVSVREINGAGNTLPVDTDLVSVIQGDGTSFFGYVDNALVDSRNDITTGGAATQLLTLGATPEAPASRYMSGTMRYAALWDRALTSEERAIL